LTGALLLICAALIAVYPLLSLVGRDVVFLVFSWGALAASAVVVRRTEAGARLPWQVLFVALAVGAVASTLRRVPALAEQSANLYPILDSIGNALLLAAALAVVARRGRNDIGGLIDTTIVSLALGGILWSLLLLPHMEATDRTFSATATLFVTVMALCGALGALVRLLETDTEHIRALRFLLGALSVHLAACVLLALWTNEQGSVVGRMMFMTAYLCVSLFALDRSATRLAQPGPPPRDVLGPGRLVFLGAALVAVPLVTGARALMGYPVDALFLAIGSAAMVPLVLLRIGRLSAERHRSEAALRHLAAHDPLTGVLNRREFTERLSAQLRQGDDCVLIFCDLDGFKTVNDRFGHTAGDRLLVEVAQRLRGCIRENDFVGRFGGDEFLVLFRGAGAADMPRLCDRIRDVVAKPFHESACGLTISVGAVASEAARREHSAAEELIRHADMAMYASREPRLAIAQQPSVIVEGMGLRLAEAEHS
jgi:diguanylate cyclase (GGDEF)-like protein